MKNNPLPRLDQNTDVREKLLPHCRLSYGEIWEDPKGEHKVGCLDAANDDHITTLMGNDFAHLAVHDPPYNLVAFEERNLNEYIQWCQKWVELTIAHLNKDASLYVWLGADQRNEFQPLPDFMIMMRQMPMKPRSLITMRNQRGFGTQKNWMAVRQELLYYVRGNPTFNIEAEYTDIPKILRGYYKEVNGSMTENGQRSKSENIRAGNVWVDVQQVFYRMEENVSGCYAQKPIKAIDRVVSAASNKRDLVLDFFAHSGTTLLSCERLSRRCFTVDTDPIYCEIAIRRLERFRSLGHLGWQNGHPFEDVLDPSYTTCAEEESFGQQQSAQSILFGEQ
jgi:site-specific DNA-methyltransferase (adenine-specific)